MKKLKLVSAMVAVAVMMCSVFNSCNNPADEILSDNDAVVNAAAITDTVDVGPTNATPGQITNIVDNTTWTATTLYRLNGFINVAAPATLTIEPGTRIEGVRASRGTLIIARGARINAWGTARNPVVFTSNQATKAAGHWGGVIICGAATINNGTGDPKVSQVEGLTPAALTAGIGAYGGSNDDDDSGTFKYVRIEYAGIVQDDVSAGNETNGLTMAGVGRLTDIDHVEVAFSNDDGFEWFGGSVNCKYLFSYRNRDDDFDTDNGYKGKLQFLWAIRDPAFADNDKTTFDGLFVAGSGSNGFESDNNATATTTTPRTQPIVSNATIYGPRASNPASISTGYGTSTLFSSGGFGVFNRRRSLEGIHNSAIFGWTRFQYNITTSGDWSATTYANDVITIAINNTLVANNTALAGLTPGSFTSPSPLIDFLNTATQNRVPAASSNVLTTLGLPSFNILAPNPVPNVGSILLNTSSANGTNPAARFPSSGTNTSLNDPFFNKPTNFRGAFAPARDGNVPGSLNGTNGWDIPTSGTSTGTTSWVRYFSAGT